MIEDGQVTIEHATAIVDVNGEESLETIHDRTQAVEDGQADDAATNIMQDAFPSPAPSFTEIPEICGEPSNRRSSKSVVSTKRLHNDARDGGSRPQISSINRHSSVYTKRLHKRPIGLCLKRAAYHYRRRVPTDLVTVLGCREIWRTLGTDSFAVAVRRIHRAAAMVESQFEQARADLGSASDQTLFQPLADGPPSLSGAQYFAQPTPLVSGQASTPPRSIGEVYDMFIADPRHTWSKRTVIAHETTRKWVIEAFDADTAITDITREKCREFVDLLRRMPAHADKRFPDMKFREVIAAAKARGEHRFINTANLNAYINRFGGVMHWAIDEGYIDRNPLKGLKLPDPVKRRDKRMPFSIEQLRCIFTAPLYTGCLDDERGYAVAGSACPRRARFWVPLIALFSGLRMNEICQLEVGDIQHIDGIACFKVAAGLSEAGQQKRVKTAASERLVPVHHELIGFGFLAFVEGQHIGGEVSLFPDLPLGHLGYRSTSLSKWFSRFLVSADATAPLTCFHSFRHNFRDGLREAMIDRGVALALGGWVSGGNGAAVSDNYGGGYTSSTLALALNQVRYDGLDLSHLWACSRGG
jgi:integrase